MASKKYVKASIETATNDLTKKGLIVGGGLLAITMIGDLIGDLRTNSTRRAVSESLEGIDGALERIEAAIIPPQSQEKEKNEVAEGSENGPSDWGEK